VACSGQLAEPNQRVNLKVLACFSKTERWLPENGQDEDSQCWLRKEGALTKAPQYFAEQLLTKEIQLFGFVLGFVLRIYP
jgi:hypothetical protein